MLRATQQFPSDRQAAQWSFKRSKRYIASRTAWKITRETCLHKQPPCHMAVVMCAAAVSSALVLCSQHHTGSCRAAASRHSRPGSVRLLAVCFPATHCWQQAPVPNPPPPSPSGIL